MSQEANEILDTYHPLVKRIARSACYSSATIDLADLTQIGEIAVLRAIKTYDPSSGTNIHSYVARIVRQDIYNEAARFLGIFTVDHRVTALAAKVNKLHAKGHTDEEIATLINKTSSRNLDANHVLDLRIAYNRRQNTTIDNQEIPDDGPTDEDTIQNLLDGVINNDQEQYILKQRILGNASAKDVAKFLKLPRRQIYKMEADLRDRIRIAIESIDE